MVSLSFRDVRSLILSSELSVRLPKKQSVAQLAPSLPISESQGGFLYPSVQHTANARIWLAFNFEIKQHLIKQHLG